MRNILTTVLLSIVLLACHKESGPPAFNVSADTKSVEILNNLEEYFKPCIDMSTNENSTVVAIVTTCTPALAKYERIGKNDLISLQASMINQSDKDRLNLLLDNMDGVRGKVKAIEMQNEGNVYFETIVRSQKFAEATQQSTETLKEAKSVSKAQDEQANEQPTPESGDETR
ncbi:hypothetical protein Xoosp13_193 [Xanthomonas phage Xoo-sp13]|nr:hypothetical protein Xoosp13_193 [Xanthomonas phage Xoo-sp13]